MTPSASVINFLVAKLATVKNLHVTAAIPVTRFGEGLSAQRKLNRGIKGHFR